MKDWKKLKINPELGFESVIKSLQNGGAKMSLVVDKDDKLLGTITDGDIRRALLKKFSMQISAQFIMNNKPVTVKEKDSDDFIKKLMKKKNLFHIPVIDNNGIIIDLKLLHELIDEKKHDDTIFILAGGYGKRLLPLTKDIPKPMIKIGEVPILERIINKFKDQGFYNFIISTHYQSKQIEDYFDKGDNWDVNIDYIREDTPLGTAGSLGLIEKKLTSKQIVVINADIISQLDFVQLLNFHKNNFNKITICTKEYSFQIPFGVVNAINGDVKSLEEKPVKLFNINAGIYVIDSSLLKNLYNKKVRLKNNESCSLHVVLKTFGLLLYL